MLIYIKSYNNNNDNGNDNYKYDKDEGGDGADDDDDDDDEMQSRVEGNYQMNVTFCFVLIFIPIFCIHDLATKSLYFAG